jgi:hypothetical protein
MYSSMELQNSRNDFNINDLTSDGIRSFRKVEEFCVGKIFLST